MKSSRLRRYRQFAIANVALSPSKPPSLFKNFPQDNLYGTLSEFFDKVWNEVILGKVFSFGEI